MLDQDQKPHRKRQGFASGVCRRGAFLALLIAVASLAGCGMDGNTAAEKVDQKVYAAIDTHWQESFGSQTDIRIDHNPQRSQQAESLLETVSHTQILTLEQAVQLAVLNSPEYRTEVEQLYLTGLQLADARHLYALIPFAGGAATYRTDGTNETLDYQAAAGAGQWLSTGATILADMTVGYVDVLTGDIRGGSSSIFRAAVVQPLLRGADRIVVLETLTQAQQNTLYAVRDFNRFRKTFCVSVVSDYYRLTELARRTAIAQENVERLETLVARMNDLTAVGRLARYELDEARQDLFKANNDLLDMQKRYAETLDIFKVRLNIPPQIALAPSPRDWLILPDLLGDEAGWTEENAVQIAVEQRLDLANTLDQIVDAKRKVHIAENSLGADLALVAAAAPASGTAQSRYELGLQGSLPLDRVTEANNYRRATIALAAQERLFEQQQHQVVAEVRKAWRDMEEAHARYRLQKEARDLAQKRLENTTTLLHYGRANTRDVLDAQEDLYEADDEFTGALADFAIAQMNFLRDTETLWILPDGGFESQIAAY